MARWTTWVALCAITLLAAACAGVEPIPTPADEPISLERGQPTLLEGLTITLETVEEGPYTDPQEEEREGPHALLVISGHLPDDRSETVTVGEGGAVGVGARTLRLVEIVDAGVVRVRLGTASEE
jgi:hypothetical protein